MSGRMEFDGNTVYSIWRRNCDCPIHAGNRKEVRWTFFNVADAGTPVCAECGDDYEFTGTVIVED